MIPLTLFLLACGAMYLGTIQAAFNALMRVSLRLLAEGYDTAAIADTLAYSERTIKNVIHDVTSRLHLRNRSHAVAFAMRTGVI